MNMDRRSGLGRHSKSALTSIDNFLPLITFLHVCDFRKLYKMTFFFHEAGNDISQKGIPVMPAILAKKNSEARLTVNPSPAATA
jgi:hypothetical protein